MRKALRLSSLLLVLVALLTLTSCAPKSDKVAEKMNKKGYIQLTTIKASEYTKDLDATKVAGAFVFATGENGMIAEEMKGDYVVAIYFTEKANAKEALSALKEAYEKDGIKVKKSGKCIYFGTKQGMKDFA